MNEMRNIPTYPRSSTRVEKSSAIILKSRRCLLIKLAPWSSGKDTGLWTRRPWFESRRGYKLSIKFREEETSVFNPLVAPLLMLDQIIYSTLLITGALIGEGIASRYLGVPRARWLYLLEILVYIVTALSMLSTIQLIELQVLLLIPVGAYSAVSARAVTTLFGKFSRLLRERKGRENEMHLVLDNLFEKMLALGLPKPKCEELLISSGFDPKLIRKISQKHP